MAVCLSAVKHNWDTMKTAITNYIGSLNWGYRVALRDKSVNYLNAYAEFIDPHKIKVSEGTLDALYRCLTGIGSSLRRADNNQLL